MMVAPAGGINVSDLFSAYPLDEDSGNFIDQKEYADLDSYNGVTREVAGKSGNAIQMSGTTSYVGKASYSFPSDHNGITISWWAKILAIDGAAGGWLAGHRNNSPLGKSFQIFYSPGDPPNYLGFGIWGVDDSTDFFVSDSISAQDAIADELFHHYVMAISADGEADLYYDNSLIGNISLGVNWIAVAGSPFYLATRSWSITSGETTGIFDELYLWKRKLTSEEVSYVNSNFYPY